MQELGLLTQGFLHDFSPILEQMPTIKHLLGLWCTGRRSNPVTCPTVPADHLNTLMDLEPRFEDLLITAHQEIDDPMFFQINENGSSGMLALRIPNRPLQVPAESVPPCCRSGEAVPAGLTGQ
jgi:hypothetical protein